MSGDSPASSSLPRVVMDRFCLRQFVGASRLPCTANQFVEHLQHRLSPTEMFLHEGYAPFCKHLIINNFLPQVACSYTAITTENLPLLRCEYQRRTEKELAVLTRYFPFNSVVSPPATYLDVILYSYQQVQHENAAMSQQKVLAKSEHENDKSEAQLSLHNSSHSTHDWQYAVVSIKPQNIDQEVPMLPITMMRNALGVNEGGSGVPLDRGAYEKSIEFWSNHAAIQ